MSVNAAYPKIVAIASVMSYFKSSVLKGTGILNKLYLSHLSPYFYKRDPPMVTVRDIHA